MRALIPDPSAFSSSPASGEPRRGAVSGHGSTSGKGGKQRPLADFLPTLTIAAKNLATEMTNYNVLARCTTSQDKKLAENAGKLPTDERNYHK